MKKLLSGLILLSSLPSVAALGDLCQNRFGLNHGYRCSYSSGFKSPQSLGEDMCIVADEFSRNHRLHTGTKYPSPSAGGVVYGSTEEGLLQNLVIDNGIQFLYVKNDYSYAARTKETRIEIDLSTGTGFESRTYKDGVAEVIVFNCTKLGN